MSAINVLENLRRQWSKYNSSAANTSSKPGKPKQQVKQPAPIIPPTTTTITKPAPLKTQFESECYQCHATVVFNTIWWDDFKNCYIPLDPSNMLEHRCKKIWSRNSKLQAKIFHTF